MIDQPPKTPSESALGELAALERAAANALDLGRRLGTPVLVMRDGVLMDIAADPPQVWKRNEGDVGELMVKSD